MTRPRAIAILLAHDLRHPLAVSWLVSDRGLKGGGQKSY
jgi:hypothetical protein